MKKFFNVLPTSTDQTSKGDVSPSTKNTGEDTRKAKKKRKHELNGDVFDTDASMDDICKEAEKSIVITDDDESEEE